MEIPNLTDEELKRLQSAAESQDGDAWHAICDDVKRARDGYYPPDWYQKVIASGLTSKMGGLQVVAIRQEDLPLA